MNTIVMFHQSRNSFFSATVYGKTRDHQKTPYKACLIQLRYFNLPTLLGDAVGMHNTLKTGERHDITFE